MATLDCLALVSHQVISLIAITVVGFAWEGVWGLTRCRVQLGMSAQKGAVALRFLTFGIKVGGGVAVVVYAQAESTFSHQTMLAALTVTLLAAVVALGVQRTRA